MREWEERYYIRQDALEEGRAEGLVKYAHNSRQGSVQAQALAHFFTQK